MDKFHSDVCDTFFDTDRIEFIDTERSKEEYVSKIKYDLEWLGIDYDETFNQSSRFDIYQERADLYPPFFFVF